MRVLLRVWKEAKCECECGSTSKTEIGPTRILWWDFQTYFSHLSGWQLFTSRKLSKGIFAFKLLFLLQMEIENMTTNWQKQHWATLQWSERCKLMWHPNFCNVHCSVSLDSPSNPFQSINKCSPADIFNLKSKLPVKISSRSLRNMRCILCIQISIKMSS